MTDIKATLTNPKVLSTMTSPGALVAQVSDDPILLKATVRLERTMSGVIEYKSLSSRILSVLARADWGDINGDPTVQADLMGLFNGKADLNHTHDVGEVTNTENLIDETDLINQFNSELA